MKRRASDFRSEIAAHLQMEADRFREAGLSEAEARAAASRSVGNVTRIEERFYEATHWMPWDDLCRDVLQAIRRLRAAPSFAVAAVVILAVAIGANAVVFGALSAVLHPVRLPQAQSLYVLQAQRQDTSLQESYPDYKDFRDRNHSFDGLAAFNITQAGLTTGTEAVPVWIEEVTGNFFQVLRVHPYLGRLLAPSDERGPNSAPYAVISYGYWHSQFHNDASVVGRVVEFDRHPFTIVGVAPRHFRGTIEFFSPQFFLPLIDNGEFAQAVSLDQRADDQALFVGGVGHLKSGVTPAAAVADLNAIGARLNRAYPKQERVYSFSLKRPGLYGDFVGRPARAFLAALMLLAGLTLIAACANLGGLFTARAQERSRELAVRLAMGAGRMRVIRSLLTEAVLVSIAGGALGLYGSIVLLRWLSVWSPMPQFPIHLPVAPSAGVYVFAAVLAVVSGPWFSTGAVLRVLRMDPYAAIKGEPAGGKRRRGRATQGVLLGVQLAACAMLITASLVAVRGLTRTLGGNFGIHPQNALLVGSDLKMSGYSGAQAPALQKRMLAAVGAIPGVSAAGMADWVPLGNQGWRDEAVFKGNSADLRPADEAADATVFKITPGYLRAAQTSLLAGRALSWHDDGTAPRVALVNQEFARVVFGSPGAAMGRDFRVQDGTRIQIIGVVENGKYNSLTEAQRPAMFLALQQWPVADTVMVVRSGRNPQELGAAVRGALRGVDPSLVSSVQTWQAAMSAALFAARLATLFLGLLGLLGAMLSITGIFGMAAFAVSRRRRELGIRLALGARPRALLGSALGPALKVLAWGSAAGLVLGVLASGVLGAVVYEASPRDPLVLAGAVLAMVVVGLIATWIPAQRALHIDPLELLRED
ncbi:MAG: ADOP family duplicated permease [Terriglobales bacterium]